MAVWDRRRSGRSALCALWLLILPIGDADAQTPASPEGERPRDANAACLGCHTEAGLRASGHPGMAPQDMAGRLIDPAAFDKSNHRDVQCVACHVTGFAQFPHADKPGRQTNGCDECHARLTLRIEDQFLKSVHEQKLPHAFTCTTCHDPHVFLHQTRFGLVREAVRQDNAMCLQCHASPERFAAMTRTAWRDLHASHRWLPNIEAHWDAVRCVECHTPVPQRALSHEVLAAAQAERDCVSCHSVDSALRVRLYRHLVANEREQAGFLNSVIMNEAYVIGATRNRYLDQAAVLLVVVVAGGITLHGLGRIAAALVRRRRGHG